MSEPDMLSRQTFALQLKQEIESLNSSLTLRYDEDEFRLVGENSNAYFVNLANLFREYCQLPEDVRKDHLKVLAKIFAAPKESEVSDDFTIVQEHLRPKVYNRSTFVMMELESRSVGGDFKLDIPLYPLGEHLLSSIAYDTDTAIRSITNEQLEEWGVSYYEAMEVACQNLEEATLAWTQIGDGFYASSSGDNYDASRVLLVAKLKDMAVIGSPVVILPQRDALFLAGSEDEQSLQIMFELTAKIMAEDNRPLSPLPLILKDDEWVDWEPPKSHAIRERFEAIRRQFLAELYATQSQLLLKLGESEPDLPFPASYSGLVNDAEQELSYCVWSEGIDSLLPNTDLVMLANESELLACNTFERVKEIVGGLMVLDDDYYPARYRVREFPSQQMLAEIGTLKL